MKQVFVASLLLCLLVLTTGLNFCSANPFGPPNAVTITIQNDGTVNPADSPIKHVGGNQYVLTENLNQTTVSQFERYVYRINIEKDNVVLEGANHTVEGYGRVGIEIAYRNNVTIQNIALINYELSVEVWCSSNVKITDCSFSSGKRVIIVSNSSKVVMSNNTFLENYEQPTIWLDYTNSTTIYGNNFTCQPLDDWLVSALDIQFSQNNLVAANTFTKYYSAVNFLNSSSNYFYQNNFLDNQNQVQDLLTTEGYQRINEETKKLIERNQSRLALYPLLEYSVNVWENNYWSNYNGASNSNGVGTSPYVIDERNADNSPLTIPVTLDKVTPLSSINSAAASGTENSSVDINEYLPTILVSATIMGAIAVTGIFYKKKSK